MRGRAFTLVELLVVVVILAIIAAIGLPLAADDSDQQLLAAARKFEADMTWIQSQAITRADVGYEVCLKPASNRWYLAVQGQSGAPINDPHTGEPMRTQLGPTSPLGLDKVTIASVDVHDRWNRILLDELGSPHFSEAGQVRLAAGAHRLTISIAPITGQISTEWP